MTDLGRKRLSNEDHFVIMELTRTLYVHQTNVPQAKSRHSSHRGHVFVVADGVGGSRAGEVASGLTVEALEDFLLNMLRRFSNLQAAEEQNALKELENALLYADARILKEMDRHPEFRGMGTTLTLALAVNWKLFVAHVGDSRCYLFSGGELRQLTRDHTVTAELLRRGVDLSDGGARHPYRHVLTNLLGGHEITVQVELHKLELQPEDVVLLCSDGVTEMLPDQRIAGILRDEPEPQRACERLVAEANDQGGVDNITAIVARFTRAC